MKRIVIDKELGVNFKVLIITDDEFDKLSELQSNAENDCEWENYWGYVTELELKYEIDTSEETIIDGLFISQNY